MERADWDRIRFEFQRVVAARPQEQAVLLREIDPDVRPAVEDLLAAHGGNEGLLVAPDEAEVKEGAVIGAYRLIREIGRGGMGVVYEAERCDGEIRQRVALKFAGGKMLPMEAQRRFIRERQILAQLEHPNIVRFMDGGLYRGQRYLVMELAEGRPVTQYCEERSLGQRERLEIFLKVCEAVAFAHQRLVLHRDLKPANILVSREGGVKVLDFGIARLLEEDRPDGASTMLHPLTLSCASPEQFSGEPLTLSSDVYALGLLLYELLAGVNPQCPPGASFAETCRWAMEGGRKPPSLLRRGIPRDIDAIVLKALEKEKDKRYPSAGALAADIHRFLEGRPVEAVRPTFLYRFSRLVHRHRLAAALSATLGLAVIATLWTQLAQAQREARRFQDAQRLIRAIIFEIQPGLEPIPATLPIRKKLVERALEYLEAISRDAGNEPSLLRELARAYAELSRIQGNPLHSNLGDRRGADASLKKARELLERALAAPGEDVERWAVATVIYSSLTEMATQDADEEGAAAHAARAVSFAERYFRSRPSDARAIALLAHARFNRALAMPDSSWNEKAEAFLQVGALYRKAAEHPEVQPAQSLAWRRSAGNTERRAAELFATNGRPERGLPHARRALEISEELLKAKPDDRQIWLDAAADLTVMGGVEKEAGRVAKSIPYYRRAMTLLDRAHAADPVNARVRERLAATCRNYAEARIAVGKPAGEEAGRALKLFEDLERSGQLPSIRKSSHAKAWLVAGHAERARGREAEACAAYKESARRFGAIQLTEGWLDAAREAEMEAGRCQKRQATR